MTIENESNNTYPNFNYSLNSEKLLNTNDGDIDVLLKTYNLSNKALGEMITSIREWYQKQPHLPQGQLHDRMIIGQLITRGFSVEQCKEKIDNFFTARHRLPEVFCNWDILQPKFIKYMKQGYWIVPPQKTKENHRVVLFRIIDPEDLVVMDVVKLGTIMLNYRIFNDSNEGDHWVLDLSKSSIKNIFDFNPLLLSNIYYFLTSCYALKVKGIHLVNVPPFAASVLALAKRLMKPKHVARLHIYDSFEKLLNVLPREVIPKDLGGTGDVTCQEISDNWCETLSSDTWRNFFLHAEKFFITDESKRIGSSNINNNFGLDGSFRKLELD